MKRCRARFVSKDLFYLFISLFVVRQCCCELSVHSTIVPTIMGTDDTPEMTPEEFILQTVATAYSHVAKNKFMPKYETEANQDIMRDFISTEDQITLIFSGDNIVASLKMPATLSRVKSIVFTKVHKCVLKKCKSFAEDIIVTEVKEQPIDQLGRLVEEIYLPLLSNPLNQDGWGEVASKEVVDKFHSYMSSVSIMAGTIKGQTYLPLPPVNDQSLTSLKNQISLLEGMK